MAVLCILSHGKEETVFGHDGKEVPVKDLFKSLETDHMTGKPKLIIVQACQGGIYKFAFTAVVLSIFSPVHFSPSYAAPFRLQNLTTQHKR